MNPHRRTPRANPIPMSAKGCSPDKAAAEDFFGRPEQEFYHNRDHQDQSIDDLHDYLVWYLDERIKT